MKYSDETDMQNFKKVDTSSWDTLKDNVFVRLINGKYVDKYGDNVINTPFMDLTLTFSVQEKSKDTILSYLLTEKDLERFNVTAEEVKDTALHNTTCDRKKRVMTFKESMLKSNPMYPVLEIPYGASLGISSHSSNSPEHGLIRDVDEETDEENILILTNRTDVFGASYIASFEILNEIYDRFNENFYIIPLSIHKVMCIRSNYATKNGRKPIYEVDDDLLDMVESFNDSNNKSWKDILSYKIYYYFGNDGNKLFLIK